ncbi:hemolysin family protein [Janibacter melonis]|uniref:hemolysin family protein n=1 Tax=Janibacter melonis TaxID=262209 RepID=UPI00204455EB|nr:hemolysin family protein [Janibacter melonis]MCM3555345.1 hemolysin family protein [Janibacter melonis]
MNLPLVLAALAATVLAFVLVLAESAISTTSRVAAEEAEEQGRRGAAPLRVILADSTGYVAVLNFVRAMAESTAGVLVAVAAVEALDGLLRPLLIAIAIMVLVSFVIVGVSPRTLGRQHSTAVALAVAPVVVGLRRVLGPVARLLIALGNAVTPGKGYRDGPFRSEAELRDLVDLAGESSLIEATERRMLHSVFDLGDTLAREVMVPRTDMITIEADKTARKAVNLFIRSGFSRVPVVGESTDDIVGLLYLKDVIRRVTADPESATLPVTAIMRPAPFVPESKPVDDLLREMQRDHTHAAVVVDEYGGTAGLVTIEDILEEIVGEIDDEYDRETPGVEPMEGGLVRVPATMHVDDLAELFDVSIEEDEVDTVGGLIGKIVGRVPIVGSRAEVAGLALTAEKMSGRRHRVASVVVERLAEPSEDQEQEEAS